MFHCKTKNIHFRKKQHNESTTTRVQEMNAEDSNNLVNKYRVFFLKRLLNWIKVLLKKLNFQTTTLRWTKMLQLVVWAIIYIVQASFASYYSFQLYQEYSDGAIISEAHTAYNNSVFLRNASLCVNVRQGELDPTER